MAALLAPHQNPGKISLGLQLGASCSAPHPLHEHLQDYDAQGSGVSFKWGAKHMKGYRAKWAKQAQSVIQGGTWE